MASRSKAGMQAAGPPRVATGAQCLAQSKSYRAASDRDILIASGGRGVRNMQMKKKTMQKNIPVERGRANKLDRQGETRRRLARGECSALGHVSNASSSRWNLPGSRLALLTASPVSWITCLYGNPNISEGR